MINCLETISINFPSENHSTTWMDRRSSESRRGLVALDVVSTEAFQWPAFHPSTCHGRGLWTHPRPQNQVFVWQSSMFCKCCCFSVQLFMVWIGLACVWMCFFREKSSIFQPCSTKATTCIGWNWGQHMSEPAINCYEHGCLVLLWPAPKSNNMNLIVHITIIHNPHNRHD